MSHFWDFWYCISLTKTKNVYSKMPWYIIVCSEVAQIGLNHLNEQVKFTFGRWFSTPRWHQKSFPSPHWWQPCTSVVNTHIVYRWTTYSEVKNDFITALVSIISNNPDVWLYWSNEENINDIWPSNSFSAHNHCEIQNNEANICFSLPHVTHRDTEQKQMGKIRKYAVK